MRSSFNYTDFVKLQLENSDNPLHPSEMLRQAINDGSPHSGDDLRDRVRKACESAAASSDIKRVRTPDIKGYSYLHLKVEPTNNESSPR